MSQRAIHRNPAKPRQPDDRKVARAPYNFVPLPEGVVQSYALDVEKKGKLEPLPRHDRYDTDRLTGRIHCALEAKTPLFIRGQTPWDDFVKPDKEKKREHGYADDLPEFYRDPLTGQPMIPASSLRGMLRALVEIITASKFGPLSERAVYFRSVADKTAIREVYQEIIGRRQAGWIVEDEDGSFAIRPAPEVAGRTYFKVSDGLAQERGVKFISIKNEDDYKDAGTQIVPVFFVPGRSDLVEDISPHSGAGTVPAVMICSGLMKKKKKHWVVPKASGGDGALLPLSDEVVADYLNSLTDFQLKSSVGGQKLFGEKGVLSTTKVDEKGGAHKVDVPVFYVTDAKEKDRVIAIGHTANFRLPYQFNGKSVRLKDMVPGDLSDESIVDFADALFGFAKPKRKDIPKERRGYAGRVRLGDAKLIGKGAAWLEKEIVIPKILSGPKPTSYQHYVTQPYPDEVRWTDDKGNPRRRVELMHYGSPRNEAEPRGHKLYWHKKWVQSAEQYRAVQKEVEEHPKQYTQIKPVKPGATFSFEIRFENLSQMELGALLWALTLPTDSGECCHKLGMGKPLGLGSVKIAAKAELDDRLARYTHIWSGEDGWACPPKAIAGDFEAQTIKAFETQIMERMGKGGTSFREQPRIRMLYEMLAWRDLPEKDRELIRYMEIEHEVYDNEYKDRPVLPDPLHLKGMDPPDPNARPPKRSAGPKQGGGDRQPLKPKKPDSGIPDVREPSQEAEELFKKLFEDRDEE